MQTDGSAGGVRSLLTPIGYQSGDCGYCKAEDTSQRTPDSRASYYGRSRSLSPEHYQELMDRGWRRSGTLLYLPDVLRSCCPHYTIRLPASQFQTSRDHRQALNRWNRFVIGETYAKEAAKKYPVSKAQKKRDHNVFDLARSVHESESSHLHAEIKCDHNFEVTLEVDNFSEEKYQLFDDYQRHVHHESDGDISRAGFKRFLCSSPIQARLDAEGKSLGSFHQCYRLDGRLIAMGVLDLLPHSVSGVYFLYHSDFEKWSFGKLSALRELTLALENGYEHYYMGYYIHGCKKMRYKGDYKPQYVLDYDSLEWDVLDDEMRALMDRPKYTSMSKERARIAAAAATNTITKTENNLSCDKVSANGENSNSRSEEDDIPYPNPIEAFASNLSLLDLGMPGVMTLEQVKRDIDLEDMQVSIGRGTIHRMQEMVSWHAGSETDGSSFKGIIAEFAAAVGPTIAREITVDLCR